MAGDWADAGKDVQPDNATRHAVASHDKVIRGTETSFDIEPEAVKPRANPSPPSSSTTDRDQLEENNDHDNDGDQTEGSGPVHPRPRPDQSGKNRREMPIRCDFPAFLTRSIFHEAREGPADGQG